jgi:hypothetical protein
VRDGLVLPYNQRRHPAETAGCHRTHHAGLYAWQRLAGRRRGIAALACGSTCRMTLHSQAVSHCWGEDPRHTEAPVDKGGCAASESREATVTRRCAGQTRNLAQVGRRGPNPASAREHRSRRASEISCATDQTYGARNVRSGFHCRRDRSQSRCRRWVESAPAAVDFGPALGQHGGRR